MTIDYGVYFGTRLSSSSVSVDSLVYVTYVLPESSSDLKCIKRHKSTLTAACKMGCGTDLEGKMLNIFKLGPTAETHDRIRDI